MIEIRPIGPIEDAPTKHFAEDDVDEIVATEARVHLEVLSDNAIMLNVEDRKRTVRTIIFHAGRVPLRVRVQDVFDRHGGKAL